MVPTGSFLTVKVDGQVWGIFAPADIQTLVSAELQQIPLDVRSFTLDHADVFTAIVTGQYLKYTYHATVVVQTHVDYAQPADVTAIVKHAFFDATGVLPDSASEVVAEPDASEPVAPPSTSWTDSVIAGAGSIGASLSSVVTVAHDDVSNLLSGIGGDFKLLLLGILAIVLVIVLVAGWSPNAPNLVPRL